MPDEPNPSDEELEERLRKLLGEAETADDEKLEEIELKLRDIEDKMTSSQQERLAEEGLFDAEFEARLGRLHQRADQSKAVREQTAKERARQSKADQVSARGLGVGLSAAYIIIGLPLMGAAIGWGIDKAMHTTAGLTIGVISGAVLGLVMAIGILGRQNQ